MWRRWGSDPGDPQYSSGFEEEFNRALERRERTGAPEICLFFKEVDSASLDDPGDQLRKVLSFKEAVKRNVLFREFKDVSDWKEQAREVFERHLLRLRIPNVSVPNEPVKAPSAGPEGDKGIPRGTTVKALAQANRQIIGVWTKVGQAIEDGDFADLAKSKSLDRLLVARIGLAATSLIDRDVEVHMPGAHLVNLLFKHRDEVELTAVEWHLILKANLANADANIPGWYWRRRSKLNIKRALVYLSCYGGSNCSCGGTRFAIDKTGSKGRAAYQNGFLAQ